MDRREIEEGLDDVPDSRSASPLTPSSRVESLPDVLTSQTVLSPENIEMEGNTTDAAGNVDADTVAAMRLAESLSLGGVFWGKPDEIIKTSEDIEREASSLTIVETTLKRLGPIHAGTVLGMYADLDSSKLYGEFCRQQHCVWCMRIYY